jgi:C-terminal processing protease CtpA/Prc
LVETNVLENESIGYLYVGSFGSGADIYYEEVIEFYQEIEDFDHLLIDIRGNTGGFYSKWVEGIVRPLIDEEVVHTQHLAYRTGDYVSYLHLGWLSDVVSKDDFDYLPPEVLGDDFRIYRNFMTYTPTDDVDFNGSISVLTDTLVYSAAEGFTTFCREYDFASIYGTSTGGDGIMLWPLYFVLPNSKLVINSASGLGLDGTGHANEEVRTQPDVYFESAFGDWNALIDYTIDALVNG